ncbi:MAG: DUF6268 family outer membrane beta-barrel protein [Candidatus Methylacidiphilales bacterium]
MHNYLNNITNALFNNWLNKAFLFKTRLSILAFVMVFIGKNSLAQNKNYFGNNLSISFNTQSLSMLKNSDSLLNEKYNFRFSQFSIGYKHELYSKINTKNNTLTFSQISVLPALQLGNASFGAPNLDRTLINLRLSLLGIFHTSAKSTFLVTATTFANEDEYTLPDATLRYAGIFLYNRKVDNKFSYRAGATFTYLFGEPLFLPVLGFRLQTSKKSILNVNLPYSLNWKKQTKIPTLFYGFSLRPNGGINQYQNKLSVDTTNQTLMLRRRTVILTADIRLINKKSTFLFQLGFNLNPRVQFTKQNTNEIVNNFKFNGSNSLFANITYIWFIGPDKRKTATNKNSDIQNITEDEVIENSWLDF